MACAWPHGPPRTLALGRLTRALACARARGPALATEYAGIQDLMNHAVHAQASAGDVGGGGVLSLAARLRRVLAAFHEKKSQPGVRPATAPCAGGPSRPAGGC